MFWKNWAIVQQFLKSFYNALSFIYLRKRVSSINRNANTNIINNLQVMWAKSTDMGCDYAICEPNKKGKSYMTVACMYGPTGNVGGQAPFNDTVFCHLRDQYEVIKQFGLVPRCDGLLVNNLGLLVNNLELLINNLGFTRINMFVTFISTENFAYLHTHGT